MAKNSHDREDLLREATALVRRVVLSCDEYEEIVVGFRRTGAISFYFDQRLVLQFNTADQLRRVYDDDSMFIAESQRLCRLERVEASGRVELLSSPLNDDEQAELLHRCESHLLLLNGLLLEGKCTLVGQVTDHEVPVVDEVRHWLDSRSDLVIAKRPNVSA